MARPRHALTTLAVALVALAVLAPADADALGLMLPKNSSLDPFAVQSHRVDVTVTNHAAVTQVTQVFKNNTSRPQEAVFVFPLPDGATVSDFSLWINGKKTKGAVLDKKSARQTYERIVRRTQDPGLVEYMDGKLFRASIFPIPANGTQKLELKFAQVLQKRAGVYRLRYPLRAGSQYVTAKTEKDFTLRARIKSGVPISTVYSPSHNVDVTRKSNTEVVLGTEKMHEELDRDFELFLSYSKEDIGLSLMTHDPDGAGGEDGYFMMALAPQVESAAHEEIGQTYTFVVDTSGSMGGDKIDQARKTLEFCLARLGKQDHFNIVRFSTGVESLYESPTRVTKSSREAGLAFAGELRAAGGTAISEALDSALSQKTSSHQPHQIIFITDGVPTIGETSRDKILQATRDRLDARTRLFTFGIGFDIDTRLLDGLADHGRGRSDYIEPDADLEEAVATLYTRISSPVLTDVSIDWGDTKTYDIYPRDTPDLFAGDQVVLFGRYKKSFVPPIVVAGRVGKKKEKFAFGAKGNKKSGKKKSGDDVEPLEAAYLEPLEFLPKLWATRKVGFLLAQIRLNGESDELKNEVVRLAKKFGLVTPYTSYLAVDDSELRPRRPRRPRPDVVRRDARPGPGEGRAMDSLSGAAEADESAGGGAGERARTRSAPKKKSRDFDGFGDATGKDAVSASKATRELKESETVAADRGSKSRYVSGHTFDWDGSRWVQSGVDAKKAKKKAIEVEAYSAKYFELLRTHPEMKKIASKLGDRVVVKLGKKLYRIVPAKTK